MKIINSKFWKPLWETYRLAPSIAFCRVPELEFASRLHTDGEMLDHCCGDGRFASLAWPGRTIAAGCDINPFSVHEAIELGIYREAAVADASKKLPLESGRFQLIFNNSALEHIPDIDATLAEVRRVLAPSGSFVFNVLNSRYFEWWPMEKSTLDQYAKWQPFIHALSLDEWTKLLERHGLEVVSVDEYFPKQASRMLARLDYLFSSVSLGKKRSWFVDLYRNDLIKTFLHYILSGMEWQASPGTGAGLCIRTRKR
jgi:SAM-dependent methyltransferase